MNSVNIIGNIGHDLELRHTQSGKAVLNLSIAVNNFNGESEWFRVVIWNEVAENTVKYCSKGSKIGVTGRLSTNEYTDKNGQKRTNVEIVAQQVEFLSYQNEQDNQLAQPTYQSNLGNNNKNRENNSYSGTNQGNAGQSNQNTGQQNRFTGQAIDDDPFESNEDVTNISDDDLPF